MVKIGHLENYELPSAGGFVGKFTKNAEPPIISPAASFISSLLHVVAKPTSSPTFFTARVGEGYKLPNERAVKSWQELTGAQIKLTQRGNLHIRLSEKQVEEMNAHYPIERVPYR